ncbi:DgyrCDS3571 [Dimorphilus gyrociliatus]|uniref:DgyrCDS3571 n=1 Tax=Dimorphilus gyrociliatus TaxID=2664684 RepID=A0A7I8VGC2_9ANNE|nr:DgyrCDS3571 [Dimorphilus gyrociliatus]
MATDLAEDSDLQKKPLILSCQVEHISYRVLIASIQYQNNTYRGVLLNCQTGNLPGTLKIPNLAISTEKDPFRNVALKCEGEVLEKGKAEVSALSLRHTYNKSPLKTEANLLSEPRTKRISTESQNCNSQSATSICKRFKMASKRKADENTPKRKVKHPRLHHSMEKPRIFSSPSKYRAKNKEYNCENDILSNENCNRVVWAKLHGYSWWPGRILETKSTKYSIGWFGSTKMSTSMPKKRVCSFIDNFHKLFIPERDGNYKEAVSDALTFLSPTLTIDQVLKLKKL